jgi:predicted DNA-binding transcriptional regulator AlpA
MSVQEVSTRAAMTVTEVAALCQLSRSRFYELVRAGVFPEPVQNESAKRPVYVRDQIEKCLDIKQTGVALNGTIIVFNRKRASRAVPKRPERPAVATTPKESAHASVVTGLKSLGMADVTDAQVERIVADLFPDGISGQDLGEVIRGVFLELKKQQ